MISLISDLRHATRRLVHSPAFTVAAALTLSLGIAANASIFTVVQRVILRPLPYPDSEQLIWVDHLPPGLNLPGDLGLSQGLYAYYRERARTFESLALYQFDEWTLSGEGDPQRIAGIEATASLADALRVAPALGRWFTEQEADERAPVVVISHGLWMTQLGGDPAIVGRSIRLDGTLRQVVGVMPRSFAFPDPSVQLYEPEPLEPLQLGTVSGFNYRSIARLRDGFTVADVERELNVLIGGLKAAFPGDAVTPLVVDAGRLRGDTELLRDRVVGAVSRALWILMGMVGLVLLIACANVANLFLVRSEARQREVAVRRALGAGRSGIVRYFLSESLVLAAFGGAAGLGLAWAAVRLLVRFGPENLPRLHEIGVGAATIAWTVLLVLLAALTFGAIPMLRRNTALAPTLREGGRGSTVGRRRFRVRNALMAGQIALALLLLVGSGLMVRSFLRLSSVDPGFDPVGVLTFDVALNINEYPDRKAAVGFHEALLARLTALPGVESAGAVTCLPLAGSCWGDALQIRGRPIPPGELPPLVQVRRALPGFTETLRIPVLAGRTLEAADHRRGTNAVVLTQAAARALFPNEDPLGRQLAFMLSPDGSSATPDSAWYTVVGVVGDTPTEQLAEEPFPAVYLPVLDRIRGDGADVHRMAFAVRSTTDPLALVRAVREVAAELNANIALGNVRSLERTVADALSQMAFTMVLLLIAAGIALLLGAVGIYGVISYVVSQRTGEIGVRMALGARPGDVASMLLRQSGVVIACGLAVGLAAAFGLSRFMSAMLFEVTAADPLTYAVVTAFLIVVAALASWLPARRAAALDPTTALRSE